MDIASLILDPGTERRERKFSRQTLEQDNADIQRALRKKSRKVRRNNQIIQNRGHPAKIYKFGFKNSRGFPARRVAGDHGQGGRADHPGGHPADQGEEGQVRPYIYIGSDELICHGQGRHRGPRQAGGAWVLGVLLLLYSKLSSYLFFRKDFPNLIFEGFDHSCTKQKHLYIKENIHRCDTA